MLRISTLLAVTKALALSAMIGVAGGTMQAAVGAELTPVTYGGSTWIGHFPVWVGMKKGFFGAEGLDVKWESFGTSSSRMSAMVSGSLDFAGTGVIPALSLMAAGSKSFTVLAAPDSFATVQGLIAKDDLKSLSDLKGKKIGVTFASSGHLLILDLLKQQGLDANKDVMLINMPVAEMPAALKSSQIDAAVAWTPTFNVLLETPGAHLIADDTAFTLYKDYKIGTGPDVLIASTRYMKEHPAQTAAFMRAYLKSIEFIKQNPDDSAQLLTELTKLDLTQQKKAVTEVQWHTQADQRALMVTEPKFQRGLERLAAFMVENKQLNKVPAVPEWFNVDYLK